MATATGNIQVITGTTGVVAMTPDSVPGDTLLVTVIDADLNTNIAGVDSTSVVIANDNSGESENS